ncbi:toprim domain-containing protein [Nitrobacter sp.]|uniref:DUF7146 domain-containing protein n=1 Tax=Nitrobacter sp. TaxID=29420 RepID=UPI0029CABB85|nr:toprim domain-containing protein [Nitrobacter sp.]
MTTDLATVRAALSASMNDLARHLYGEPNRRMSSRRELRFGRKGSLAVVIDGPKAGSWCDHEAGGGGGPLDLIMHSRECSFRDALDTARDFLGAALPDATHEPPEIVLQATDSEDETRRIASAMSYWNRSQDPRGTIVETYLASRCIVLPDGVAGEVIRFCAGPRMMVALLRDIHTNEPCGIHRTLLNVDGSKIEKKMLGRAKGAAIKLSRDEDVTHGLHVGEGIESTLSFLMAGYAPAWALGSAGAIAAFPVLSGVECLTIFGENDKAGDGAADVCADRWLEADREVTFATPQHGDGNDILKEVAA